MHMKVGGQKTRARDNTVNIYRCVCASVSMWVCERETDRGREGVERERVRKRGSERRETRL